jgi:amino acid transporter
VLAKTNKHHVPYMAVITQSCITVLLIVTAQFEAVLTFVGFSLSIFTFLTVSSVFILRKRKIENTEGYKTWGYPVTPILFLLLNGFTIYFVFTQKPTESLLGLLNVAIGGLFILLENQYQKKNKRVMLKQISLLVAVVLFVAGCSSSASENHTEVKKDTTKVEEVVETPLNDSLQMAKTLEVMS